MDAIDVDTTRVSLPNDDVTKRFDILVSIAMHFGQTFIPPLDGRVSTQSHIHLASSSRILFG